MASSTSSRSTSPHSTVAPNEKTHARSHIQPAPASASAPRNAHGSSAHPGSTGTPARTARLFDRTPSTVLARKIYLKIVGGGIFAVVLLIFSILPIFWGSLWKIPAHELEGWVVDFDQGPIGTAVTQQLLNTPAQARRIAWTVRPASDFPGGAVQVARDVLEEKTWVAVVVNQGASSLLSTSLATPNATYDGKGAVSAYAVEARNENGFRNIIRPSIQNSLDTLSASYAIGVARNLTSSPSASNTTHMSELLQTSPQTVTAPLGYQIDNLAPFNIPVATAVTFVGLIYQLILSFFVVMLSDAARTASRLSATLRTKDLIALRLGTAFAGYFVVSLFYSLLSLAFGLDVSRKFGHSGFLVFWMLNYCSMLACGLALEAMLTLLTTRFIPFFLLTWLIVNISVCVFPIEVMPSIFRYGYAAPFYNVSQAVRSVVFGTKNVVGQSFGILIAWIAISCITVPLFQWLMHQREAATATSTSATLESDDLEVVESDPAIEKTDRRSRDSDGATYIGGEGEDVAARV